MIRSRRKGSADRGLSILTAVFVAFALVLSARTVLLPFGKPLALAGVSGPQPVRGAIELGTTLAPGTPAPLAANTSRWLLAGNPKIMEDPVSVATALSDVVGLDRADAVRRLANRRTSHAVLAHALTDEQKNHVEAANLPGITLEKESVRTYPLGRAGAHVVGFLGFDGDRRVGQYGLEARYDRLLAGKPGASAATVVDGSDIITTLDRQLEDFACTKLSEAVARHGADGGSLVVVDPKTGAVLALCGEPSFDPNAYGAVSDAAVFLNPAVSRTYEPGSVFKAVTLAGALETGAITPDTTYEDSGSVSIGKYTIKNSDGKAHGVQTMRQVLEESLNTGAIFAARKLGETGFADTLRKFGFGAKTGVDLPAEASGNISKAASGKEIYLATASYGQGLTVTPLQLVMAYAAIANRGALMQPYVVAKVVAPDGRVAETQPREVRAVLSPATATQLAAMLVGVVERGHGQRAGVPGYYIAGKTGTAQVPAKDRAGYEPGVTVGTFAGFGPVDDPKFAMVVVLDHPKDVQFAESSAAPLFGEVAAYVLRAFGVAPTRTLPVP
jgi:cell division protein FtsI/penicillin-binding protein 2